MAVVLVVDDDPSARLLVRTVLEHAGHDVLEAGDAEQARAIFGERVPDLTLIDLSLPGTSGAEVVRGLRKDSRTRDARIALYTASSPSPALRDFVGMYGLCAIVPKPSEPAELIQAVAGALALPAPVADIG